MRRARDILFLVGGIVSLVTAVTFVGLGVMFEYFSTENYKAAIEEGLANGTIHTSMYRGTPKEVAEYLQLLFKILGILFFVVAAFALVNSLLSFVARTKESKGLYIANCVFGVLSCVEFNLVGAVFGFILLNRRE